MLSDRIRTSNQKEKMRELIMPFLKRIKTKEDVMAVMLLGGLSNNNSKNHTDVYSDIDVSVVYDDNGNHYYSPNYEFYLFDGERQIEVNVHEMLYSVECNSNWDTGKKEAYSKAEILYEKNDNVRKLIEAKVKITEEYRKNRLALILGQYKWYVEINPIRTIERGLYMNGIDLLNKGIDLFVEALYLYNYQYMPHNKWRLDMALDLNFVPKNYVKNINNALITESIDANGIIKKRNNIIKLFSELIDTITKEFDMNVDELYEYACKKSYTDRQLLDFTYSDTLIKKYNNSLNDFEKIVLASMVNYYLVGNNMEFLNLKDKIPEVNYKKVYNKIRRMIINEEKNKK